MFFKSKSDSDDTGFINNQPVILQHHMYTHPINKIFDHCYAILRKINFWMKLYSVQLAWFILNAYKELTHVVRIELNFSLVTSLCYGRFCWSQENQTSKLMTLLQKQIQCTIMGLDKLRASEPASHASLASESCESCESCESSCEPCEREVRRKENPFFGES